MTVETAAKHAAPTTAEPVKRHREISLGSEWTDKLNELADVKLTLSEAKLREKELTDELKAAAGPNADKLETLVVRVAGVIRAKINLRGRSGIDKDKLQSAFPEAFEACQTETTYQQVNPA